MIIDTHTHYDDEAFDADREQLIRSLPENGISKVINVGASLLTSRNTMELVERFTHVYGAVGVHPDEVGELDESAISWMRECARHKKIVAIGEIGLDYYWDKEPREKQKHWFIRQLELAEEMGLPVIIHSRDAAADMMELIKDYYHTDGHKLRGVMHCYSYSIEQAREYLDMGLYLGIGGVSTFGNAKKLKEIIAEAPIDRLLLETDCPYLAPVPYRGKRNSSLLLPYVAAAIAELRGITADDVIEATAKNAHRLFIL